MGCFLYRPEFLGILPVYPVSTLAPHFCIYIFSFLVCSVKKYILKSVCHEMSLYMIFSVLFFKRFIWVEEGRKKKGEEKTESKQQCLDEG